MRCWRVAARICWTPLSRWYQAGSRRMLRRAKVFQRPWAGVAIAAALMPPICTIGLGIALRDISLAIGANLLFLANIAFIIAAQYITFLWMGMHPTEDREGATLNRSRAWWLVLFIITVIILLVFARLGSQAVDEAHIRERLQAEAFHGAVVVEYQVITSVPLEVLLIVQSDHPITPEEVTAAQLLIDELYRQNVDLTVVERQVVLPLDPLAELASGILQEVLPRATISDVHAFRDQVVLIRANIRDFQAPTNEDLELARAMIASVVDTDVVLEVAFQQTFQINGSEATNGAEL